MTPVLLHTEEGVSRIFRATESSQTILGFLQTSGEAGQARHAGGTYALSVCLGVRIYQPLTLTVPRCSEQGIFCFEQPHGPAPDTFRPKGAWEGSGFLFSPSMSDNAPSASSQPPRRPEPACLQRDPTGSNAMLLHNMPHS